MSTSSNYLGCDRPLWRIEKPCGFRDCVCLQDFPQNQLFQLTHNQRFPLWLAPRSSPCFIIDPVQADALCSRVARRCRSDSSVYWGNKLCVRLPAILAHRISPHFFPADGGEV